MMEVPEDEAGNTDAETSSRYEEHEKKQKQDVFKSIQTITENVRGSQKPLNVIFIGTPGVGKSSLICSIAAALSQDRWREVTTTGSYGGSHRPLTSRILAIRKCGNEHRYPQLQLPTLIDIPGLENEYDELRVELLTIIFYGKLSEGDAIDGILEEGRQKGPDFLQKKYEKHDEKLKVDRVVFVASATEDVPSNLIKSVTAAARPWDNVSNKREIPVFGVLTKCDKYQSDEVGETVYNRRYRAFVDVLGLRGAEHRLLTMFNYCEDVDPHGQRSFRNFPHIDLPVLRFMEQICDPAIHVINADFSYGGKGFNSKGSIFKKLFAKRQ